MLKLLPVFALAAVCGCGNVVDVTKTAKGFYQPTDPNEVEILETKPDRPFIELGTVSSNDWDPSKTARLHNAIRAKSAPLGANAVIILNSGMARDQISGKMLMWCTGVAIRWQ